MHSKTQVCVVQFLHSMTFEKSDPERTRPARKSPFTRVLASLLPLFGAAAPYSASAETEPGEATIAALPPEGKTRQRERGGYKFYQKDFKIMIDKDAGEFWSAVRGGSYKEHELADDVFTYASEKSPRGYWDALLAGGIPRSRFLQDKFIKAAMGGVDGVEIFFSLIETKELNALFPTGNTQTELIMRAAETDPVSATAFIRSYHERHDQNNFPETDTILNGVLRWRARQLADPSTETISEDSRSATYKKLVDILNNTYVLPPEKRGGIIADLDPKAMYRIATVAPDEIFTSSYKRVLVPLMRAQTQKVGLWTFLQSVDGKNQYTGSFFKLASQFGEMYNFLRSAKSSDVREIGTHLISTIVKNPRGIEASDTTSLLEFFIAARKLSQPEEMDTPLKKVLTDLEQMLVRSYQMSAEPSVRNAFGIIGSLYVKAARGPLSQESHFKEISEEYPAPDFSRLNQEELFDEPAADGIRRHRQRWYFPDSADGRNTFAFEISAFRREGGWNLETREGKYVALRKRIGQREALIYMNVPDSSGVTVGDEALNALLQKDTVHTVALAGHSFDVEPTFARIENSGPLTARVFGFRTCGSTKELERLWNLSGVARSPLPVVSKGTADKENNHRFFSGFINTILQEGNIDFPRSWPKWKIHSDYVPPHENYSAAAIYMLNRARRPLLGIGGDR